jgi:hypothetical protein
MEDKTYAWALFRFFTNKIPVKILETGICRGTKLLDWYYNDPQGIVARKPIKENSRTKILLNCFLNKRVPIVEGFNPEKVICYLYHQRGIRIVTAKHAVELVENQLHGLQVRSIHMVLSSVSDYYNVYKLSASNENGEILQTLTYGKFFKDSNEEVKNPVIYEKSQSLLVFISNILYKDTGKRIKSIKLDLAFDSNCSLHIIKITEIVLSLDLGKPEISIQVTNRTATFKSHDYLVQDDDDLDTHDNADNITYTPLKVLHEEIRKKKDSYKTQNKKPAAQNSDVFLEMVAKTFDRERKALECIEIINNKKAELAQTLGEQKSGTHFLSITREKVLKKHGFRSINEVMQYLEITRPKVWVKDYGSPEPVSNSPSIFSISPINDNNLLKKSFASTLNTVKIPSSPRSSLLIDVFRKQHQEKFLKFMRQEEDRIKKKFSTKSINLQKKFSVLIGIKTQFN